MALPLDVNALFNGTAVEWARIEWKEGWNPEAVLHTICAFANDLHNWGGGYIVVGVAEQDGRPILPPTGVPAGQIDAIQKDILNLGHRITPTYIPLVAPVLVDGRHVVVIWAPGGQNRPYKAPLTLSKGERQYDYYVRLGSSTVKARGEIEQELLQLTASIPFDDRTNHHATLGDLQLRLIQAHLQEVKSDLFHEAETMDFARLCEQLRIVDGPPEALHPRNVGLLFFSDHPEQWFDTAWIDVVHMPDGPDGDDIREKHFTGPLGAQLRAALAYLRGSFVEERVVKRRGRAEADRFYTYPYEAIEEALANAVYHRAYDVRAPIEVRVLPQSITITSYPGPDITISREMLSTGRQVARRYRNRRIGEFLKELHLTEGRGTGVPKILRVMNANGSPVPLFDWDDGRNYFSTTLPIHPRATARSRRATPPSATEQQRREELLARPRVRDMLEYCRTPRTRAEIMEHFGLRDTKHLRETYLAPLIDAGLLEYTEPEAPRSPTQRYRTTAVELVASPQAK